ncbi:hypothetical protein CCS79_12425 [Clostridium diolis]|uniref:hypothetical protein n=1 Tax=Clostridium diolis TaxID=223919 RepID=UPI000B3FDAAF|nr:hypothetical protein [Clostridium diolis]OVE68692.1 hypothetical protein CCS79_12425 [Clostridium diolis]
MLNNEEFFYNLNETLEIFLDDPYGNKKIAFDIQMSILNRILLIEDEINKNEEIRKSNKKITKIKSTDNNVRRELSSQSKTIKDINILYKEDMKKLRTIVDSIAFSYFSKYDLKPLVWKQSPGFIGGKTGLKKELEIFESYFETGKFAILNDITNSLKFGDLTIDKNGKPDLLEVKTSSFIDKRVVKQRTDIQDKLNVINNDYIENFEGTDLTFKRIHSEESEINYVDLLQGMIKKAFSIGESVNKVEDGLTYIVLYNLNQKDELENKDKLKEIFNSFKQPHVFALNFLKSVKENYTPFPIIIRDSMALQEFYDGNLIIIVVVDMDILKNKLDLLGYTLKSKDDEGLKITFRLNGKDTEIIVSNYHFYRLGRELLSLDWFISSIDDTIKYAKSKY